VSAADIALALGAAQRSGQWWRCVCPVHGSRGATLALRDGDRALIVKCFAGCDPRDILAELRRRGLLAAEARAPTMPLDAAAELRGYVADAAHRRRRLDLARDMLASSMPASGTVVERYLGSRGYTGPLPPSLRFIGMHAPYGWHAPSGDRRPVMMAAVEHADYGFVGVTRTFLAIDGSVKASLDPPRLFTGSVAGGAVQLAAAAETLLIGEGIETVLAGISATGLPGWAALSTSGLKALLLPPLVQHVIILADNDKSGAGERAARTAAARWRAGGRRVSIYMSPRIGVDAADLILAAAAGGRHAA
jgi:hypothetical protein